MLGGRTSSSRRKLVRQKPPHRPRGTAKRRPCSLAACSASDARAQPLAILDILAGDLMLLIPVPSRSRSLAQSQSRAPRGPPPRPVSCSCPERKRASPPSPWLAPWTHSPAATANGSHHSLVICPWSVPLRFAPPPAFTTNEETPKLTSIHPTSSSAQNRLHRRQTPRRRNFFRRPATVAHLLLLLPLEQPLACRHEITHEVRGVAAACVRVHHRGSSSRGHA